MNTQNILGYEVCIESPEKIVANIYNFILFGDNKPMVLSCINPHSYVVSKGDEKFKEALKSSDWIIADGIGVVLVSRLLPGGYVRNRTTGSDIFEKLSEKLNSCTGRSVFFLGSTQNNLEIITKKYSTQYPNISIAGSFSPPFREEFSRDDKKNMIEAINKANPDILWVGLTAPKQEKMLLDNIPFLHVKFAAGIGAVFDFYSGNVVRSHFLFRLAGLEWLPRLLSEPSRLWRRTLVSGPIFLLDGMRSACSVLIRRLFSSICRF